MDKGNKVAPKSMRPMSNLERALNRSFIFAIEFGLAIY